MKTSHRFARVVPCLLLVASSAFAQGPLNPPGPPAPMMKTLDQAEPRIPIASLPVTITTSGSYYFTGNLQFTAASGNAITVSAPNVTIDLMGYTLSSTAEVTGIGISIFGNGCTVRNGAIVGTTTVAISGSGASKTWTVTGGGFVAGIGASGKGHRFVDLTVARCRQAGIEGSEQSIVVTRCVAYQNGGVGLAGGVMTECSAYENGWNGIEAGQNLGGVVTASRSYDNKNMGIVSNLVANCQSQSNGGVGINAIKVQDSIASFNGGNGIEAAAVTGCTARSNGGDGIRGSFIKDNSCTGNTGAGIRFGADGARIEGNNCFSNGWGIQGTASTDCFIVRNSCKGNASAPTTPAPPPPGTGDYDFPTSNTFGPIVTVSGDMSTNAAASHPWANFRY